MGALLARAEAENELLEIGAEFSAALRSYAQASPQGQPTQPTSLEALLRDPRFPNPRRHLRRIFVDPMTGMAEWGLVRSGEGGPILGVYSLSQARPLKIAKFDERFVNFDNKQHLSDWKFTANGQGPSSKAAAPGQGATPEVTMFPPPPEPSGPVVAPVEEQQVLREVIPPPRQEPVEAEQPEEQAPQDTGEPAGTPPVSTQSGL